MKALLMVLVAMVVLVAGCATTGSTVVTPAVKVAAVEQTTSIAPASAPANVKEINDARVVVKLSGEKLEIKTLDLGTNEGLTEFSRWGRDMYFEFSTVENTSLKTFSKMMQGSPLYTPKTRLFRQEGQVVTFMDVPGNIEDGVTFQINGVEYAFAGRGVLMPGMGYPSFGRLVNLSTGEISVGEFQFNLPPQPMVSPEGELYWVSRSWYDDIRELVHAVYSSDGKRLGNVIGPEAVVFLEEGTIGGVYWDSSCQYQVTLNLETGDNKSKQLSCEFDDEDEPKPRPARVDYL